MQMNNLSLDVASYEVMGYDPFQTSYGNQLLAPPHVPPPPLDSPNFNIDYSQQVGSVVITHLCCVCNHKICVAPRKEELMAKVPTIA